MKSDLVEGVSKEDEIRQMSAKTKGEEEGGENIKGGKVRDVWHNLGSLHSTTGSDAAISRLARRQDVSQSVNVHMAGGGVSRVNQPQKRLGRSFYSGFHLVFQLAGSAIFINCRLQTRGRGHIVLSKTRLFSSALFPNNACIPHIPPLIASAIFQLFRASIFRPYTLGNDAMHEGISFEISCYSGKFTRYESLDVFRLEQKRFMHKSF